ncbi:sulfite exporter TauE/SafE family protein [Cohnella soli]|uniref:Sulfite exporter TauE/SafE family protein n=1 Tax=Cohnella soli TaxID=425005 RepID=A0ABW0I0B2_9BACL
MTGDTLVVAMLAGLTGAPHCVIMCGGIGASVVMEARRNAIRSLLAYHFGRVTTYALTGAVMGAAGSFLNIAGRFVGFQAIASIVGGALIILWAFRKYAIPLHAAHWPGKHRMKAFVDRLKGSFELTALFLTGLMLGMLPCGLTYSMQIRAASTGSWAEGLLTLLVFGLSTIPVLLVVALSAKGVGAKWRRSLRRAGFYVAMTMGVLTMMKGFSANGWIPSIHPWLW